MVMFNSSTMFKMILPRAISAGIAFAAFTTFAAAQENPLIVEADESLQWLRAQNQYVATGNASAEQNDMRLTANVIIAHYETANTKDGDHDASEVTFVEGKENSKLTRASLTATAHNITYDIVDEYIELTGGNPTVINGEDRMMAKTLITYSRKTRQITATGDAKVLLANGQTLMGDNIKVTLNQDENDIQTVEAEGGAVVISPSDTGERRAEATTMTYKSKTGLAVLTGDVKILENNNLLKGDVAEIDTITGTSTIKSLKKGQRVGGVFNPAQ